MSGNMNYCYKIEKVSDKGEWVETHIIENPWSIARVAARNVLHTARISNPNKKFRLVKLIREVVEED